MLSLLLNKHFIIYIYTMLMSGTEHAQKKKPSVGKFTEDIGRAWEHYLTYRDQAEKRLC